MGTLDKKFNSEYINNFWNENIVQKLSAIKKSWNNVVILHLIMHIILFCTVVYSFKNYTLPSLGVENDLCFYILAIIPNIVLGYYTRNVFIGYKFQIQNIYSPIFDDFNIKNTFGESKLINLRDIKSNIPNIYNTAYIENFFSGKYDDIPFELAVVRMEKLSCTPKNKFYTKNTGGILVLNDFLDLKYSASISKNLDINAGNPEDKEKIKEFMDADYFGNFNNLMNVNGILFKNGKIFIFLKHTNSFGLPKDIRKISQDRCKEFFNALFKDLSVIGELQISQKYENVTRDFVYPVENPSKRIIKYIKAVLLYIIFLMVTFYMVTILTITIMLAFNHQYWSFVLWVISPIISIFVAFFLTKESAKQIFNKANV